MKICVFGRYRATDGTEIVDKTTKGAYYATIKIKKAIKGETINGFSDIRVGSQSVRLDANSRDRFLKALWTEIANDLCSHWNREVALVPIPGSTVVDPDQSDFRNAEYAEAIAAASNGMIKVSRALHWDSVQEKQRADSGPRRMEARLRHMIAKRMPELPVLLFDDVMTSGSTLQAAEALLMSKNVAVLGAVVVLKADSVNEPRLGFEVIDPADDFFNWPTS